MCYLYDKWLYLFTSIPKYYDNSNTYNPKNINTVKDGVIFLQQIADRGFVSSEEITDRLSEIYSITLPTEVELANLSLLHQSVIDTGGVEEFSILTILMCATESIIEAENIQKCMYIYI